MARPTLILVDSDVLIAHLRGESVARDWLVAARNRNGDRLASSVIDSIGALITGSGWGTT